jgi:hypothetical protein
VLFVLFLWVGVGWLLGVGVVVDVVVFVAVVVV